MSDSPTKTTRLDWALRYIRLGWPVFPCTPRGKEPLTEHGCKDATLNEGQARAWWMQWPDANIGVATGHRFFVLDVDLKSGGEESFQFLIHQHGAFPDTVEQITGTGGKHLLFLMPDFPVRNSANAIAPGLDIRGRGGYIVVAPSIHPDTGRRYEWDGLKALEEQPIAPAPAWLLEKLKAEISRPAPSAKPVADAISEGSRNTVMFKLACSQRRKGLSAEEILATLVKSNELRCKPPLPLSELQTIAASSARYAPDARASLFAGTAAAAPETPAAELPLNPADVEAAVDAAIAANDLVAFIRLAPELAKVRPQFRAVYIAKGRKHFGRDLPESLFKEFQKAIRDAESNGTGQNPPAEPPRDGDGDQGDLPPGPDLLYPYPLTDGGNGERIVALWGKEIRYCTEMKKWLVWDGRRWAIDEMNVMRQKAKLMARLLYLQAGDVLDDSRRKAFETHARNSESAKGITNALIQAATETGIPISALDLDQQPFLLNCLNGAVDLRTGELLPFDRELLITKLCPVAYDPKAQCPQFLNFIHWAMGAREDAELSETTVRLVGFLQRALGYGLTGDVIEKALFVLYGQGGNNGKTTLLTLFRDLLGRDYSSLLMIETVLTAKQTDATARADMADLRGSRFVQTSEVGKDDRLNERLIKYLTQGMGQIKSCRKYENPIEFGATFKFYLDCNYRPVIKGTDEAIWRRLKCIPFEVTIAEEDIDYDLPDKLRTELQGVLAWVVRGSMAWHKEGLGDPPEISSAGQAWRAHDDLLREFLEDCCEVEKELFVPVADLMVAYLWWAKQGGERYPMGRSNFNEQMQTKGFVQDRTRLESGKQARIWKGLELKSEVVAAIRPASGPLF